MKEALILGGGITGLSAAWFLKRRDPNIQITLLEKESRIGGWIRTTNEAGFFFERGPRTFQAGRSPHLIELIQELELEIIRSHPAAAKRFILYKGKLRTPGSFLFQFLPYLVRELFLPKGQKEDESIYDFAARRFGVKIADTFFDPLTLGIYAGDSRRLSIRSCFPALTNWEREKGSVIRGALFSSQKARGLFTVRGGMETLIQALKSKLDIKIVFNCPVAQFGEREVLAGGKMWRADQVISALPPQLPTRSIWVVCVAFERDVLAKKGFGYLIPTQEKESVLGVVFDSAIFPEQNQKGETRLTVMIREEEKKPEEAALSAIKRHLNIECSPVYCSSFLAKNAIPQMEVGCGYSDGISVDACIQRGRKLAAEFRDR